MNVVGNRIFQGTCGVDHVSSTGKHRDNRTIRTTTPHWGGTDAGNDD